MMDGDTLNFMENGTSLNEIFIDQLQRLQFKQDVFDAMSNGKLRIPPSLFKPIECVQNGGQVLYIPDHWWHMVLNIDETVGITV